MATDNQQGTFEPTTSLLSSSSSSSSSSLQHHHHFPPHPTPTTTHTPPRPEQEEGEEEREDEEEEKQQQQQQPLDGTMGWSHASSTTTMTFVGGGEGGGGGVGSGNPLPPLREDFAEDEERLRLAAAAAARQELEDFRRDRAWNDAATLHAAVKLAEALEYRSLHPLVMLKAREELLDEAQGLREKVADRFSRLLGMMHEDTALARVELGRLLAARRPRDRSDAEAKAKAAAEQYMLAVTGFRLNRHVGLGSLTAIRVTLELASLLVVRLGDWTTAVPLLRRVIKGYRVKECEPFALTAMKMLADCLAGATDDSNPKGKSAVKEALDLYQQCLDLHRRHSGENHVLTLAAMEDVARTTHRINLKTEDPRKVTESEQLFRAVLKGRRRYLGSCDDDTVATMVELGDCLLDGVGVAQPNRGACAWRAAARARCARLSLVAARAAGLRSRFDGPARADGGARGARLRARRRGARVAHRGGRGRPPWRAKPRAGAHASRRRAGRRRPVY